MKRGELTAESSTQLKSVTEEVLPLPRRVKRTSHLGAEFDPGETRLESVNSEQITFFGNLKITLSKSCPSFFVTGQDKEC